MHPTRCLSSSWCVPVRWLLPSADVDVNPWQVGDMVWSMLPGAHSLSPTTVADVRRVVRTGYANVHTLQGAHCTACELVGADWHAWQS